MATPVLKCLAAALAAITLVACVDASLPDGAITVSEAKSAFGENATVCGTVSSGAYFDQAPRKPTFINIGKPFPNQEFTLMIWGEFIDQFDNPVTTLKGKVVCVSGAVEDSGGIPLINVSKPQQIVVLR